MLNSTTKAKINNLRDLLVGKIPNPQGQVQQITLALIYKFMSDIDDETSGIFANGSFFPGEFAQYKWTHLMDSKLSAQERLNLYAEGLEKMNHNPAVPPLFRTIFKQAFLPYRDATTLSNFLKQINEFDYEHSEDLGDAFEYLLSCLSAAGDAGQFRTPRHIIDFIVDVVQPQITDKILDPACGTAGFLISAYKYLTRHHQDIDMTKLSEQIIGYDISPDMVQLALVNLYLHQFPDPKVMEYDTLTSEDKRSERFDCILANPPFMTPKGGIQPHNKFSITSNRSEVLFVDYIIEHLRSNGKAGIIVPEGVIFQSANAYKGLRKMLIETGGLWGVISLPAGVFQPYSGVKTSILLIDKSIQTDQIIFAKITADGYDLGAQRRETPNKNDLPDLVCDLLALKFQLKNNEPIEKIHNHLIWSVNKTELADDYNLSAERYKTNAVAHTGSYEMVELGEVVNIVTGKKDVNSGNPEGEYPFFTCAKEHTFSDEYSFDTEALLVAGNGDVGSVKYYKGKFEAYQRTYVLNNFKKILPKYLYQCLYIKLKETVATQKLGNTMPYIKLGMLQDFKIPLPPLEIQEQIVKELDGYQAIIDGAKQIISNWKPTIEVYSEWEMVKLGEVFELSSGNFLPSKNIIEGPYPVYGGNGVNNYHNEFLIEQPTIVIGRVGEYCGAVHITEPKSWITDNALYIKQYLREVDQNYLAYVMVDANINQFAKHGGQPSISQQTVKDIEIPLPPLEVQQSIVARIQYEQLLVDSAKEIVKIYEEKVKERVERVWVG